jgi:polyisoprenoid-binding protein YceI
MLIALPQGGWARVSTALLGIPAILFWVLPAIPRQLLLEEKELLEPTLKDIHSVLAWAVLSLTALHVAATGRHIASKDGVMSRMLSSYKKNRVSSRWILSQAAAALIALQAASAVPAQAMEWLVDTAGSSIAFEASVDGQTIRGAFEQFSADIEFDPDAPETSSIQVAIELSSLRTGIAEADKALPSSDWFDAIQYPQATLRSTSVRPLGGDRYELRGHLRVRNTAKPVVLPFTLHVGDDGQAIAQAEFTVNRSDFGVGPASPAGGAAVDDAVRVAVKLNAQRMDN